jgi:hypothetical protein
LTPFRGEFRQAGRQWRILKPLTGLFDGDTARVDIASTASTHCARCNNVVLLKAPF